MLVHHPNAGGDRRPWPGELLDHAINAYLTLIWVVQPREHIHQGAFTRTIFANER